VIPPSTPQRSSVAWGRWIKGRRGEVRYPYRPFTPFANGFTGMHIPARRTDDVLDLTRVPFRVYRLPHGCDKMNV
jgi:hypothetical protein